MKIFYDLNGSLYANITNKCPCACTFCLRNNGDSVGGNDSLWLEHEPSIDEIKNAFDEADISKYNEIVFCGYGEPMERASELIEIAKYIKEKTNLKIRINTNGLVLLIHPDFELESMRGIIDTLSISLNASDSEKYYSITNSKFGLPSYNAMLNFAVNASSVVSNVVFTIVGVVDDEEVKACQNRADDLGIPLKIRSYISNNTDYN